MTLQTLPAGTGWQLFKIEGQLDYTGAPVVQTALLHTVDFEHANLLIDVEDVRTADEKGVASLIACVRRLISDSPAMQIAFIASHPWLVERLAQGQYPKPVSIFGNGEEAMRAVLVNRAA